MAHPDQADFIQSIKSRYPNYFTNVKVLDVGSLDINGNNRIVFDLSDYTGIDVGHGPNVDVISKGHEWAVDADTYDIVISTECFEHDAFFDLTLQNIIRILKPGGMFVFTCATTGRGEHGTRRTDIGSSPLTCNLPEFNDHYKNITEDDVRAAINVDIVFSEYEFKVWGSDLYFYGITRKYPENLPNPEVILCIPTLKRYDLLEKCIDSALSGSRIPDRIVVIDNGFDYNPYLNNIEVVKPKSPMCVASTWNYFMTNYSGIKIISNDDIEFGKDTINIALSSYITMNDYDLFMIYEYSCYILRDKAFKIVGRFDENFKPAYYEDIDYDYRMKIADLKAYTLPGTGVIHLGSQTIKAYNSVEMNEHYRSFVANRNYYISKWGGLQNSETRREVYKRDVMPHR